MKIIPCLLLLYSITGFAINNSGFYFQNEPINPACVALFNSSMADHPYINAINLNECQHSNAAYQKTLRKNNSFFFYLNNNNLNDGMYSYSIVGKTTNGIFVLDTKSNGGGTLVASELLLIRLVENKQFVYDGSKLKVNSITEMRLLGYIIGGDRCVGAFADAKINGNILHITQFDDPTAGGECKKTKSYSLDLGKL